MRIVNAATASCIGLLIAIAVASAPIVWPALIIGAGAVVTALVLLLGRRGGVKRYAGAGAIYTLGLAAVSHYSEYLPQLAEDPVLALVSLGSVSGLIVLGAEGGALVVQRYGGDYVKRIFKTAGAFLGLFSIVWTVLTAYEKALRYAGVGIGGTVTFLLNFLGVELPIPFWFIGGGVDATIVLFVGCCLIGFHTLESVHTSWRATKATAKKSASAGKSGISSAHSAVQDSTEEN